MGGSISRRGVLAGSAALAASACANGGRFVTGVGSRISFTTVSLMDRIPAVLPGEKRPPAEGMTLLDVPTFAAQSLGMRHVELWSLQFDETSDEYCMHLRAAAERENVSFINIQVDAGVDLSNPDKVVRERSVQEMRLWIDRAALVGAPSIRVNTGPLSPDYEFNVDFAAESHRALAEYGAMRGIIVLTENHFGHSADIRNLVELLQVVDHPNFRTILDWGNIPGADTGSVIDGVRQLAPWLHLVSAKATSFTPDYVVANYDVPVIVRETERNGFRGLYSIELWGLPDEVDRVRAIRSMNSEIAANLRT